MAEFVESIRYEADISDLKDKLRRIETGHDDVDRKTSTATGKMRRAWDKVTDGVGSTITTLGKVGAAAGVAAAGFAVVVGKQSIDAASNLDESMSKINQVFGANAQGIVDWSKTSATAFGQSQQQALEAAGTYGNLFQAFGVGRQPAQEMSQSLVELAADLASFNNTSVDDALQALQSGLSGETEPLKRFGVAMNEARLKEEALRLGLIKSTSEALDPAAKAQAAYALIMQDTTLAQGDFARTSDGLANKQRILAARVENAKAKIGEALLPAMSAVTGFIADKMIPKIEELAAVWMPRIREAAAAVADWFRANWPAIQDVIGRVFDGVAAVVQNVLVPVVQGIVIAAGAVVDWFRDNWPQIRATIETVVAWMRDEAWPVILQVVEYIRGEFDKLVVWVQENWPKIRETIANIIEAVRTVVETQIAIMREIWDRWGSEIMAIAETVWNTIKEIIQAAVDIVRGIINTATALISGDWGQAWDGIKTMFSGVWDLLKAVVSGSLEVIQTLLDTAWGAIKARIEDAWNGIKSWFSGLWDDLTSTVSSGIDDIVGFVAGMPGRIGSAIGDGFNAIWEKFRAVANRIIDGWNGLEFTIPSIDTKIPGVGRIGGGTVGVPNIPRLATGTVATSPMLAMIGEYPGARSNPEIVSPVSTMRDVVRGELASWTPTVQVFVGNEPIDARVRLANRELAGVIQQGLRG